MTSTYIGSLHPLYEDLKNDPTRELFPLHLGKESPAKQAVLSPYLSSVPLNTKTSHTRARSGAMRGSIYAPYIKKLSKYPHRNAPSYR